MSTCGRKFEDLAMEVADEMFERWDFDAQALGCGDVFFISCLTLGEFS